MASGRKRSRLWLAIGFVVVIALGLASRQFPTLLPAFLGKYPGDALWALMVFVLWAFCLPAATTRTIAVLALGTSFLVEFSQLYHAPWINSLRHTTAGHWVLGGTFSWQDLAAYVAGVAFGVLADVLRQGR